MLRPNFERKIMANFEVDRCDIGASKKEGKIEVEIELTVGEQIGDLSVKDLIGCLGEGDFLDEIDVKVAIDFYERDAILEEFTEDEVRKHFGIE